MRASCVLAHEPAATRHVDPMTLRQVARSPGERSLLREISIYGSVRTPDAEGLRRSCRQRWCSSPDHARVHTWIQPDIPIVDSTTVLAIRASDLTSQPARIASASSCLRQDSPTAATHPATLGVNKPAYYLPSSPGTGDAHSRHFSSLRNPIID